MYAILDVEAAERRGVLPVDLADIWLDAGVRLIQLRAKSLPLGPLTTLARELAARTRVSGAVLIVNDRVDAAALAGADGVHLGQDDLSPGEARTMLRPEAMVGRSTHTAAHVDAALDEPIDYLAIGPIFRTRTKASTWDEVGLSGIRATAEQVRGALPIVAIGGITLDTVAGVLAAGASSVAVISDLLAGDLSTRVREYLEAAD